jgi:hypothetical protein
VKAYQKRKESYMCLTCAISGLWHDKEDTTETAMQKDLLPKETVTYRPLEDAVTDVTITAKP